MTHLSSETLDWSLRFLSLKGDNSLFNTPFEYNIIQRHWIEIKPRLTEIDVSSYEWKRPRKLLFPKDRVSFRKASQLDPLDSLIFTSLVRDIGPLIEARRPELTANVVFSSRYINNSDSLYNSLGWNEFWLHSRKLAEEAGCVARTDIVDFYNQINHRTIITQLEQCKVPAHCRIAFESFLRKCTGEHERSLPIGPHATHLIAELSLTHIDNILLTNGLKFARYIDDYHFFCKDENEAQLALLDLAKILDREQGLSLNRSKTSIYSREQFISEAALRLEEASSSAKEDRILEVILEVTDGAYDFATFEDACSLSEEAFSEEVLETIFDDYFNDSFIDYPKIGWLLRRLTQVSAPGAVRYILNHFHSFVPVIGDTATYLSAAGENYTNGWKELGSNILDLLKIPVVAHSDYVQMALLDLFARKSELNHFDIIAQQFPRLSPAVQREIVLAAGTTGATDWIYDLRHSVANFDPWLRRAFVQATTKLPTGLQTECLGRLQVGSNDPDTLILEAILSEGRDNLRQQSRKEGPTDESQAITQPQPVAISVHGILTTGRWQKDLNRIFENKFKYRSLDYDYVTVPEFLFPFFRRKKIEEFLDDYSKIVAESPDSKICLIAHSFGTLICASAMNKYPEITFDRVIFCGSIVSEDFDWTTIFKRSQISCLLNECGQKDFWATVVEWFVEEAGPSGVVGFKDLASGQVVNELRSEFHHSDFFYNLNYSKRWIPFLLGKPHEGLQKSRKLPVNRKFQIMMCLAILLIISLLAFKFTDTFDYLKEILHIIIERFI